MHKKKSCSSYIFVKNLTCLRIGLLQEFVRFFSDLCKNCLSVDDRKLLVHEQDTSHNAYTESESGSSYFDTLLLNATFSDSLKTHAN
jgi:hypothetical protein